MTGKVKEKAISTNEYGIKGKYNKFHYNKEEALKVGKNESEIVIKDKDLI